MTRDQKTGLADRLQGLKGDFLHMRDAFGLDGGVGLIYSPELSEVYGGSPAVCVNVSHMQWLTLRHEFDEGTGEIIRPDFERSATPYLIAIGQKGRGPLDLHLADCADDLLLGLIAHELGHALVKERGQDDGTVRGALANLVMTSYDDALTTELIVDHCAAEKGYASHVASVLDHMGEVLSSVERNRVKRLYYGPRGFRVDGSLARELDIRRDCLTRYIASHTVEAKP
jgi:hypothetical protein